MHIYSTQHCTTDKGHELRARVTRQLKASHARISPILRCRHCSPRLISPFPSFPPPLPIILENSVKRPSLHAPNYNSYNTHHVNVQYAESTSKDIQKKRERGDKIKWKNPRIKDISRARSRGRYSNSTISKDKKGIRLPRDASFFPSPTPKTTRYYEQIDRY